MKVRRTQNGYVVPVLVVPGASQERVYGEHDGRLKVAVTAPPEDGKANRGLCEFLAEQLDVKKSEVNVVSGLTSRRKEVLIERVSKSALEAIIA